MAWTQRRSFQRGRGLESFMGEGMVDYGSARIDTDLGCEGGFSSGKAGASPRTPKLLWEVWFEGTRSGLGGGGGFAGEELAEVVLHAEAAFAFFALDAF